MLCILSKIVRFIVLVESVWFQFLEQVPSTNAITRQNNIIISKTPLVNNIKRARGNSKYKYHATYRDFILFSFSNLAPKSTRGCIVGLKFIIRIDVHMYVMLCYYYILSIVAIRDHA